MGLKIKFEDKGAPQAKVRPGIKLFRTQDGKRLVNEGDKEAYSLYCNAGTEVPAEEFSRLLENSDVEEISEQEPESKGEEKTGGRRKKD